MRAVSEARGAWWGEIVNDASHGKSGSAGHATPSLDALLFNGALFMKLDVILPPSSSSSAKDISIDVRMGPRSAINVPIMNDLVRMLLQGARGLFTVRSHI